MSSVPVRGLIHVKNIRQMPRSKDKSTCTDLKQVSCGLPVENRRPSDPWVTLLDTAAPGAC